MFDEIIADSTLPDIDRRHIIILSLLFFVSMSTGMYGTYRYLSIDPTYDHLTAGKKLLESFVTTIAFFGLNTGPFPAPVSAWFPSVIISRIAAAIFVSYILIVGLWIIFASHLRPWEIKIRHRLASRYRSQNEVGHILICGLSDVGAELAISHAERGRTVVVLESSFSPSIISRVRSAGAIVFEEDATRQESLQHNGQVQLASKIYVTCGSDGENAEVIQAIANRISEAERSRSTKPTHCFANISSREYQYELHNKVKPVDGLWLRSYSVPTATARELLQSVSINRLEQNPEAEHVSIIIVGWTERTQAILSELCYVMHYVEDINRSIRVICESPDEAEYEFLKKYPGVDPNNWENNEIKQFITDLFPKISFHPMVAKDDRIIARSEDIMDLFGENDILTVIVDSSEDNHSGHLVSLMKPHLEHYIREMDMDIKILYYDKLDYHASQDSTMENEISSDLLDVQPFIKFWDGVDPESVQGKNRDQKAQRVALFYHLLYNYESGSLTSQTDIEIAASVDGDFETVDDALDVWNNLSADRRQYLSTLCWGELSEEYRDSNRHAADHARIKLDFMNRMSESRKQEEVVGKLALLEHRRWCSEKFLRRWKPLPVEEWQSWEDEERQQTLRNRRIHRDLWPMKTIQRQDPETFKKDLAIVRFLLNNFVNQTSKYSNTKCKND